jgi:hypothetical protein
MSSRKPNSGRKKRRPAMGEFELVIQTMRSAGTRASIVNTQCLHTTEWFNNTLETKCGERKTHKASRSSVGTRYVSYVSA